MSKIKVIDTPLTTTVEGERVELSQWYWVQEEDGLWLGCVTAIGSNYVELTSVREGYERVHSDTFYDRCTLEPNASQYIAKKVATHQERVRSLMQEVEALTARLGVGAPAGVLTPGSEGQALARIDPNQDFQEYKTALVRAKTEELPALFKKIEKESERLASWMKAEMIPLKAQTQELKDSLKRIEKRIFTVELYAGLTESVEQILEGEPAPMSEKIHLMQRRCYMDEECLANYETGGMEFRDLYEFDRWLARPDNLNRILPFPRCVVAFRVRREMKERHPLSFIDLMAIQRDVDNDKITFLYIKNGEQLYRMNTALEFREQLFPDYEHHVLTSGAPLWAKIFCRKVDGLITEDQYQGLVEDYERAQKEDRWARDPSTEYEKFETGNVHYDDIESYLQEEIHHYNLIGILIQGLLDRSPVFHPHPPWKIWSEGGFNQALELIYDDSRALVKGDEPDFEAYRQKLNASLKTGSVTVGQYPAWYKEQKETKGTWRHPWVPSPWDPGPEKVAKVEKLEPRKRVCHYAWLRDGLGRDTYGEKFRAKFSCSADLILNIDAYTPGDFRIFFSDPRSRAKYLKWAPFLIQAEEYHAGNVEVEDPPPPMTKRRSVRW